MYGLYVLCITCVSVGVVNVGCMCSVLLYVFVCCLYELFMCLFLLLLCLSMCVVCVVLYCMSVCYQFDV